MAKATEEIEKTQLEKLVDVHTEALQELRRQFNAVKASNDDQQREIATLRSTIESLQAQAEVILPREIMAEVSPGQLYLSAIQAFIIGYISSQPSALLRPANDPHKLYAAERAIEFGELLVGAMQKKFGVIPGSKPK